MNERLVFPGNSVFEACTPLRITDLSAAQHLGFDNLVSIVNDVSARFFHENGLPRGAAPAVNVIYTDLQVSYRTEAFYGDTLKIEMAVGRLRKKGVELVFRVGSENTGKVIALARIAVLFYDYVNQKAVIVPAPFQRLFSGQTKQ